MSKTLVLASATLLAMALGPFSQDAFAQNGNSARNQGDPVIANPGNRGNSPHDRITLCHFTGNGSYVVITVSANAADAHILGHGDLEWDPVSMSCGGNGNDDGDSDDNGDPEPPPPPPAPR